MNLLDFFAKPIQSVKEALDLDPPSLTDQLIQIKNQLTEVQERLDESRAIEREKDTLILQLKDAMKVKGQPGPQMDWVQCPHCQTPFRSKQAGDYLKTRTTQTGAKTKSSVTSKPSPQAGSKPSSKKATAKPKRSAQTRTPQRTATSKTKSRRSSR